MRGQKGEEEEQIEELKETTTVAQVDVASDNQFILQLSLRALRFFHYILACDFQSANRAVK